MRIFPWVAATVIAVAVAGAAAFGSPADARPVPATGGCYGGGVFTPIIGPGPGSRTVTSAPLSDCSSPLLPGVVGGILTLSVPWNLFGGAFPASGDIAWSNGRHSAVSGVLNSALLVNTFAITRGPGSGHHIVIKTAGGGTTRFPVSYLTSATFAP